MNLFDIAQGFTSRAEICFFFIPIHSASMDQVHAFLQSYLEITSVWFLQELFVCPRVVFDLSSLFFQAYQLYVYKWIVVSYMVNLYE